MTDTFNAAWVPEANRQGEGKFNQRKAQFGDGYVQRSPDGINVHLQSWALSWVGGPGSGFRYNPLDIRDFLAAHVGQTFLWTPPGGTAGYYACEGYTLTDPAPGVYRLAATFVQDAAP
jgi:phage-related protein